MSHLQTIAIGQDIGQYRIEGLLGAGGMGVVYLAQDRDLQRMVAIKVVDRSRQDPGALRSLLEEARVVASLHHPSICGVHGIGRAGDEQFIVMEHVEGRPLSMIVPPDIGLPLETVLHYAIQIVDAVVHAHRHNIVHGDLKASNIMIAPDGSVKVLDFGLAVRQGATPNPETETTRQHEISEVGGTVPYMAPELLRGRRADVRSDIWALGVLVFEMLTGRRPFHGATTYELAAAVLGAEPLSLPRRVPGHLRRIVSRCLSKHPGHRYRCARDLATALDDVA
jgi:serine/threonine protein kinase